MIKSIVAASVLSLAFSGAAFAQATVTGAPAGALPDTAEPNGSGAKGKPHHHYSRHAQLRHHIRHTAPASSGTMQP
ncbi:hypothetical protein [Roseiarcus sp.]|uniref:hypothetical protein n=1 Tax=Roseiarcus sp. TaxID=1969460 RepID=UPI003F9DF724